MVSKYWLSARMLIVLVLFNKMQSKITLREPAYIRAVKIWKRKIQKAAIVLITFF